MQCRAEPIELALASSMPASGSLTLAFYACVSEADLAFKEARWVSVADLE
jgi:hypothetical protein